MKTYTVYMVIILSIILGGCKSAENLDQTFQIQEIPYWIKSIDPNFLVGEGFGWTYSQAKDSAMSDIRMQISKSIAYSSIQQDQLTIFNSIENSTINSEESFIRLFSSQTYAPILTGISIQNATNYYDEVISLTGNKIIHYYIQYPYNKDDLSKELETWSKFLNEFEAKLKAVIENQKNYSSIDEILKDIYFFQQQTNLYNGQIQLQIQTALNQLYSLISSISVRCNLEKKGIIQVNLILNKKTIGYSKSPSVKLSCCSVQSIEYSNNTWAINYLDINDMCNRGKVLGDIDFDVSPASPILSSFEFNLFDSDFNLKVCDPISIIGISHSYNTINSGILFLRFNSVTNSYIEINQIELFVTRFYKSFWTGDIISERLTPLIINGIDKEIKGKGDIQINFQFNCNLDIEEYSSEVANPFVSGRIYVQSLITGEQKYFDFNDINLITNW